MSLSTLSFPRHPHLGITKLSLEYQSVVDFGLSTKCDLYFRNILEVSNINVLCKLLNNFLFVILKFYRNKYCNKIYDITYYVTQKIKNDF